MPLPEGVKNLSIHIGLPASTANFDQYRKDGGKLIFIMSEEESKDFDLRGNIGVIWQSDAQIKKWLFENLSTWMGGQLIGDATERIERFAKILTEVIDLSNFDTHSVGVLTKDNQPVKNALRNFRWIDDGIALKRAKGKGVGTGAYILAAGPSLNDQWAELRRIRMADRGACFIVAGRTYKKAMEEGIAMEFVVEVEQFEWDDKIFMFAPMPPSEDTILAFPLTVCPGVPKNWPAKRMVMTDHNTAQMFGWKLNEESIDGGNSILHHMVNFAVFLGCNPITLVGADMGYPNGMAEDTHAKGTFHSGWPGDILSCERTHQEPLMVEGNDGSMLQSSPAYRNFRVFLEMQVAKAKLANKDLRVCTFSKKGQKAEGVEYVDITTWKKEEPPCSKPPASPSVSVSSQPSVLLAASGPGLQYTGL